MTDARIGHGPTMSKKKNDHEGQVSEAGSSFSDTETELGGADAVPDKTTGTATGAEHEK